MREITYRGEVRKRNRKQRGMGWDGARPKGERGINKAATPAVGPIFSKKNSGEFVCITCGFVVRRTTKIAMLNGLHTSYKPIPTQPSIILKAGLYYRSRHMLPGLDLY